MCSIELVLLSSCQRRCTVKHSSNVSLLFRTRCCNISGHLVMYLELSAQVQSAESRNQLSLFTVSLFYDVALAHNVKVITLSTMNIKDLEVDGCGLINVTALTSSLRQTSKAARQDTLMCWLCTFRLEIRSCNDTLPCPLFRVTWFKYGLL